MNDNMKLSGKPFYVMPYLLETDMVCNPLYTVKDLRNELIQYVQRSYREELYSEPVEENEAEDAQRFFAEWELKHALMIKRIKKMNLDELGDFIKSKTITLLWKHPSKIDVEDLEENSSTLVDEKALLFSNKR